MFVLLLACLCLSTSRVIKLYNVYRRKYEKFFSQLLDAAPIPSPEAKPEPCLEIIFRVIELFLTTTSSPRREYTTPEEEEPEPEPTTEQSSTEAQPTEGNSSGESPDGPSVDGPNADSPSTTEGNPDDTPNEIVPKDTIKRLRKPKKKSSKKQNDWWFGGIKF